MARIVRVTWEKIQVHKSEDYGAPSPFIPSEAGGSAEWVVWFHVKVDGEIRRSTRWEQHKVRDNRTFDLDRQLDVELDGELSIEVEAKELDDVGSDDKIPGFSRSHSPEPGWEADGTEYRKTRENLDFHYTIQYRIEFISEGATLTPGHGVLYDARYSGLWNAGDRRTILSINRTAGEVQSQAAELWPEGGRFAQLQPHVLGNRVVYNVIWEFTGARQLWNLDCDETHFRKTTDETWSWGRPHSVVPFVVGGKIRYACLWNQGKQGQLWHPNVDEAGLRKLADENWNWARFHQAHAFVVGNQVRYACLLNASKAAQLWNPNCSFDHAVGIARDNWTWGRAAQVQPFNHNGQRRYSVLWNAGQQAQLWNFDCDQRGVDANTADTSGWSRPAQVLAPSY